ncbi:DUF4435 domain-containing protein [Rhizobium sp.]|jgi:hypothetical protein|uniref:DUF4435 domain-containing protein n=1 Tax=Rhizobium sp. TaxID=391 RepID=UPI000E7E9FB9|nr:hypothetical protein [Rhizobium sp.]
MRDEDYAEYLISEALSDVAAIHEFRILYKESNHELHLFFEGDEDGLFYVPEIRRRAKGAEIHQYICGGKKNVIAARDFIDADDYDCICLYFIDRDFDDYLTTQANITHNTYITDGYSVENSLCVSENLEVAFQDLLKLKSNDLDYANIIEEVQKSLKSFHVACRSLIAWIIAAKEENLLPNLRNTTGLHKVVSIKADGSSEIKTEGFTYFKRQVLGDKPSPNFRTVMKWYRCLDLADHKLWMRGKYIYWFFPLAVVHLVTDLNIRRKASGRKKVKIPPSFRSGHLFECMGGRIVPPESFVRFLEVNL